MGVLADWQISRDIKIEPFAESALRPGVISYGVSSYGYDVRVGRHFKVFTNARCAVVDPKNFDPKSFVDIEGDFCLIPPNSFALAETIEYLEIPRDILCICVGKSTYARCFRGDTRVALVDGSAPTLEEMARRSEDGEMLWGYSIGLHGRIMATLLEQPRYIGRDALQEIVLDNDESIFCTSDHLFLRRDGRMAEADQLRPGDSLMSLDQRLKRRHEMTYRRANRARNMVWNDVGRLHQASGAGTLLVAPRLLRGNASSETSKRTVSRGEYGQRSYKVAAIRSLPGIHDVYCLTVPEAGNFALEAGVFAHNCGIICNVTPLEPEWRGKVTIEISNTTPLPAKIYAGEGIAQILFLRGEAVCQTSYGDKRGKYQDQKGLTLPFVVGGEAPK